LKDIYDKFKNPSNDYRGKPFWCWNGKLDKEELLRQIHVIKDMGMGGYFCHSRTGLATEYLGDEWFNLINACADEGEKLGLETWLYDEDRWPSGTAGGMVTENPEFAMKYIRLRILPAAEFVWGNDVIAVFEAEVDGLSFKNKKRINQGESVSGTVLVFTIEQMAKSSFYNGYTYVDTMNKDAVRKFIALTHEKYKEKCGDRFGKSIKGIFTDEPHRGAVMCRNASPNENSGYLTPYTEKLFKAFTNAFGYDLIENLPELFLWKSGDKVSKVKWQYIELLQRLFIENYFKPINEWCKTNNMIFTGHALHEDTLASQAVMAGSMMRLYEHMEYPGVDVLTEGNSAYWIVKQLVSAARQLDKKKLLSELYGCTGWQMSFESHKAVGDWQALLGINLRCPHLSWYTMLGEAKRDCPGSIFYQSVWFQEYRYVEDYFSRINMMMSQGEPVCDVLVVNPVESTWAMIYADWAYWLDSSDPDVLALQATYAKVFHTLMGVKIDFDYGDEEMMSRLCKIVKRKDGVYLKVGKAKYKSVLVAGMLTIRSSTLHILKTFINAGGNVVFADKLPSYVDAVKSNQAELLGAKFIPIDETSFTHELRSNECVCVFDTNGKNINDIYAQVRKNDSDTIIFLLNTNREKCYDQVTVCMSGNGYLEKWDVRTGNKTTYGLFAEKAQVKISLASCGEALFVLTQKDNKLKQESAFNESSNEIRSLPQSFDYSLSEPNVCVLDFARFRINSEEWQQQAEILKIDRQVRTRFHLNLRGGEMLQPWFANKIKYDPVCKAELEFEFFVNEIPQDISLAVEEPQNFELRVNGTEIQKDFTHNWWVDPCIEVIRLDKSLLKSGRNTVAVSCDFSETTNLESLYLIGSFSVLLDGLKRALGKLPEKISTGDVSVQGFPFYSAGILYKIGKAPKIQESERLFIKINSFDAACITVKCGNQKKMIAFCPFEADITEFSGKDIELEYFLTRRNTFGPLHEYPELVSGYGPSNFTTEGDSFLYESYGLLPQGMTGDVLFVIKEKSMYITA
jgi:hypothetical protein